ncbi:protein lethal(2)essential for life isoform X2 [Nomia melanderi]|uniref:protein lethal(2)essential for life isoform X2 n=1 Tax=Nomia melanderi TaxID=2448451 RepID=UPI003FCD024A
MPVVPLMFHDWWDDFNRPVSRIMDQHFGRALDRDDLVSRFSDLGFDRPARSIFNRYYRPWRNVVPTRPLASGSSTIQFDNKDNFQVILDVQQFSPEEITVKTAGNNVIIEAKHEERQDEHGFVSRHFVRRYALPPSHDVINITSSLSSDGVLTITAPKKILSISSRHRENTR